MYGKNLEISPFTLITTDELDITILAFSSLINAYFWFYNQTDRKNF